MKRMRNLEGRITVQKKIFLSCSFMIVEAERGFLQFPHREKGGDIRILFVGRDGIH